AIAAAGRRDPQEIKQQIHEMRLRLESTVSGQVGQLEVKRSEGGIVDVEFLVQHLVLTGRLPWSAETANYYSALTGRCASAIGEADCAALLAGYRVLRGVENTMR